MGYSEKISRELSFCQHLAFELTNLWAEKTFILHIYVLRQGLILWPRLTLNSQQSSLIRCLKPWATDVKHTIWLSSHALSSLSLQQIPESLETGRAPGLELLGLQGGSALCWRKLCTLQQAGSKKESEEGARTLEHSLRAWCPWPKTSHWVPLLEVGSTLLKLRTKPLQEPLGAFQNPGEQAPAGT